MKRSQPKYAKRRDDNEPEIIRALEAIGCTVFRLDTPCDLLCGRGGTNILLEVKNPNKPKSARKKTAAQDKFFKNWQGQVRIVETVDEAIDAIQSMTVKNLL